MVVFLVREKVTGLSCTNHKMSLTKFSIFYLEGSLAPVIHTNGSEIFVRFCKSGGKGIPNGNGSSGWNVCYAGYLHISFDKQLQCVCAHCSALLPLRFVKSK